MSSPAASLPTLPPPDVRTMIEKTAGYVARNGTSFEQRIKAKEASNTKFQFLLDNDPYNGYYRQVLEQIKGGSWKKDEKNQQQELQDRSSGNGVVETSETDEPLSEPPLLEYLPPEEYGRRIAGVDLGIIKVVAQFVAVNGESFIEKLRGFCRKDRVLATQLEFLNESHSMHEAYEYYLDCYMKIIKNRKEILGRLKKFDQREFLNRCFGRAEYDKKKTMDRTRKEEQIKKEKIEYASIDWQDFSVVETVEFTDLDDVAELSVPLNRNELEYRSLVQKKASSLIEEAPPDYEEGMKIERKVERKVEREQKKEQVKEQVQEHIIPRYPVPKGVKIRSAGESRLKRRHDQEQYDPVTGEKLLRCPLTGRLIAESKFGQHISILLRDPKYKEEKARYEAKFKYGSNISGDQIYENIKSLVEEKDESESESKRQKVIWNGVENSIGRVKRENSKRRDYGEEDERRRERAEEERRIGPKRTNRR
ncbi:DEKNAAC104141 [Brettanomyces naardenensis]|uniref:DEKNAAC104141 n=1 Tax=Brettanomyces naardenensis TaxID=13370 RepID=A0A448YQ58_BRENA|nr:DEKNAAC104141 [Brettanomyces naardenensis]